jgi:hypothetical protein
VHIFFWFHKQNKTKQNKTKQNKTKQNKTKQNKTKHSLTMGSSKKTAAATTVQEGISDLAPDAGGQSIEKLLVFPTSTTKEDSLTEEEQGKDSPDDDDDDYSNESSEEYHEFYLQREGMEFLLPILFEDGMDFLECECYYASIQQEQSPKNRPTRPQKILSPISFRRTLQQQENQQGKLSSCIRTSGSNNKGLRSAPSNEKEPIKADRSVRRYSFSTMPELSQGIPTLTRSQSWQDLSDVSHHVGFEQHVRVVTIYEAMDYPEDVRRSMWMSREEMSSNMRRAMRQKERQERPRRRPSQEQKSKQDEPEKELEVKQEEEALALSFHTTL